MRKEKWRVSGSDERHRKKGLNIINHCFISTKTDEKKKYKKNHIHASLTPTTHLMYQLIYITNYAFYMNIVYTILDTNI